MKEAALLEAVGSISRPLSGMPRGMTAVAPRHDGSEAGEVWPYFVRGDRRQPHLNSYQVCYFQVRPHLNGVQVVAGSNPATPTTLAGQWPFHRLFFGTSLWSNKPPQHSLKRTTIDSWRRRSIFRWPNTPPRPLRGLLGLLRHTDFAILIWRLLSLHHTPYAHARCLSFDRPMTGEHDCGGGEL